MGVFGIFVVFFLITSDRDISIAIAIASLMVARFSNHKLSRDDIQDSVIIFSYSSLPDRFIGAHSRALNLVLPCARVPGVFILFAKDRNPLINSTRIGRGLSDGISALFGIQLR